MESALSTRGGWSRKVWALVVALTAVGLVGWPVGFVGFFATLDPPFAIGGCGLAGIAVFVFGFEALVLLVLVGLNGLVAALGSVMLWRRDRWGPLLLIPSNFFTMAGFVYLPVWPGHVAWSAVVLLFAAAPACGVVLLLWALWTRARGSERLIELIVLALICLPLGAVYVAGIDRDVTVALMPALQALAPGHC